MGEAYRFMVIPLANWGQKLNQFTGSEQITQDELDYVKPRATAVSGKFNTVRNELENELNQDAIPWPDDIDEIAYDGVIGEIINAIYPYTEADKTALLINYLITFGNIIDRSAYWEAPGDKHFCNLFAMLVGDSGTGGKGSSWGLIRNIFAEVDYDYIHERTTGGLSTGEGVIDAIKDDIFEMPKGAGVDSEPELTERGVVDKRLMPIESEFGRVLQVMKREGNSLSSFLRQIWDCPEVYKNMVKSNKAKCTKPHISIIGHITRQELKKCLHETELFNGFANRFLWFTVRKSKDLPWGDSPSNELLKSLAEKIKDILDFVNNQKELCGVFEMTIDKRMGDTWENIYKDLKKPSSGLVGGVLSRGIQQVRRIAVIYALHDKTTTVQIKHIATALAVWKRCEQSAEFIFGQPQKDINAEKILLFLKDKPQRQTDISSKCFNRNLKANTLKQTLENLTAQNKIRSFKNDGDKTLYWCLTNYTN